MDKLTREEVLHVASLARIKLSEDEILKYQVELKQLLDDISKITEVDDNDDEILINCWEENAELRHDVEGEMLDPSEVLENAPHHSGNYISVPVVINNEGGA